MQMFRYWPEKGRLDTLAAVGENSLVHGFYRSFPNGKEAVFVGRPASEKDSAKHFYVIDLTTNRVRRLAFDADSWSYFSVTPAVMSSVKVIDRASCGPLFLTWNVYI